MSQITRDTVTVDANSAKVAPQISGLLAGEDGIKIGMPCRVNSSGKVVRSNGTNKGVAARVDGLAASQADTDEPVSLYGEGVIYHYGSGLTQGEILYLASANGELDDAPQPGDPEGIARVINATDIQLIRTTQPAPRESATVAGGAAGDIAVSGIELGDVLEHVFQAVGGGTDVTDVVDLTDEFTIASDGTINNDTGTDTSGDTLIVIWRDLT